MAKTPDVILQLVESFERNLESFKGAGYNETQLRQQFINPFFAALGWDIANKAGIAPAYRDVIHEDAIKIGGTTKAPDYCFRIGPAKKFFVEAKKPAVDIKSDIDPAYQLRRYAWSAKLPLSILTDFEDFAVYDCQIRPNVNDKPSTARIFYCGYKEYGDKWEQIANIFSKEAVLKGLFDKFASEKTTKKGTTTVDKEFLAEIENWRNELAKNIALRNGKLSVYDLNFAVQKTIDRILFLRICEDRGIEQAEQLLGLVNGARIYPRLFELFEKADERYNSGIFHFRREKDRPESPDELSANLKVDDDILKRIIKDLYYPQSPYEFSVMPAEILGNVYEQFLGKVIRLTAAHQAKIEEKPEVKKAGGVYYTPAYIVDYIVKNTVGKLCEGKTPKQIQKIKILDPACGSGSFLIGAYQYLLDYHRDWYVANENEIATAKRPRNDTSPYRRRKNKQIYQGKGGQWFLTIDEKKRILLNNIYGVDIDSQAVEVTKLSLLLKVLENETQESLRLFHERALPDLGNNIKCGNSLIGPDFYQNQQLSLFDDEQQRKINAFDWKKDFSEIFKKGGFDAVIGNPPWGGDIDDITTYIKEHYPLSTQSYRDSFKLFIDKGISLTRKKGLFSFIVPSAFMFQPRYIDIRRLVRKFSILSLWNVGDKVFGRNVAAPCCVFVVSKKSPASNWLVSLLDTCFLDDNTERAITVKQVQWRKLPQSVYAKTTEETFVTYYRELRNNEVPLEQILDCKDCGIKHQRVGVGMEQKGKSDLADRIYYEGRKKASDDHKFLIGSDLKNTGWYMDFSEERYLRADYKRILRENEIVYFNEGIFNLEEKIVWRQTSDRIRATIIGSHWFGNTLQAGVLHNSDYDLRYVLGLLNSKFLNFIYIETVKESGRVFPQVKMSKVRALPFRTIDFSKPEEVKKYDRMVSLVEQMLELHKKISKIKNPNEKTRIQRQIDSTDSQIDKLVYELYGLSEDEIKIVEGEE